jgi:hypothetical protein
MRSVIDMIDEEMAGLVYKITFQHNQCRGRGTSVRASMYPGCKLDVDLWRRDLAPRAACDY